MNRHLMEKEKAIELLQKQSLEEFMDIMNKLISDNKWSDNGDFILLVSEKRETIVQYVAIGIFNKSANASRLGFESTEEFINVIDTVTKKMIRKYPSAKSQINEVFDKLLFRLVRII